MVSGNLGERSKCCRIVCPLAKLGQGAGDQIALLNGIEELDCASDFEARERLAPFWRRLRGRPQNNLVMTEPRSGNLAIIGGRVAGGGFVVGARFVFAA